MIKREKFIVNINNNDYSINCLLTYDIGNDIDDYLFNLPLNEFSRVKIKDLSCNALRDGELPDSLFNLKNEGYTLLQDFINIFNVFKSDISIKELNNSLIRKIEKNNKENHEILRWKYYE